MQNVRGSIIINLYAFIYHMQIIMHVLKYLQDLVSLCNFHNYDNLRHFAKKLDPRREGGDQRVSYCLCSVSIAHRLQKKYGKVLL